MSYLPIVGSLVVGVDFCVLRLSVLELVVAGFQLVVWKSKGSNVSLRQESRNLRNPIFRARLVVCLFTYRTLSTHLPLTLLYVCPSKNPLL